jgi:hypothetical protein
MSKFVIGLSGLLETINTRLLVVRIRGSKLKRYSPGPKVRCAGKCR